MDPQGTEGNNNQPSVASTAVEPSAGVSSNPLDSLESVVAAAKEAADQMGTVPEQAPLSQSQEQFRNQFDPPQTPAPIEQPIADPMAAALESLGTQTPPPPAENSTDVKLDPSINTVDELLAKGPQTVEAEIEDPQATFVQDIKDAVNKLDEATKEKVTV